MEINAGFEREKGDNEAENKAKTWFVALAFQPLESLEQATRYQVFKDDRSGDQEEVLDYHMWS